MRVGIIGAGVVGRATARAFSGFVDEVRVYDVERKRCSYTLSETLPCDIIFICLPTPQKKDSLECDTSVLDAFFNDMEKMARYSNFVLRSTVPIGYTRKAAAKYDLHNLVHSPEFLTARTAVLDAAMPVRNIIGTVNGNSACKLYDLYRERWPHVPIHWMTSDESEAVKLIQNGFSAVKIAYFNEVRALCDKLGMEWWRVHDSLLAGGWVHPLHSHVPGPDGKRGFSGTCLPKDLANLVDCISKTMGPGHNLVTSAAAVRNERIDRREK